MKTTAWTMLAVFLTIIITGCLLDEAGKGNFGDVLKALAKKTTNGFGV